MYNKTTWVDWVMLGLIILALFIFIFEMPMLYVCSKEPYASGQVCSVFTFGWFGG